MPPASRRCSTRSRTTRRPVRYRHDYSGHRRRGAQLDFGGSPTTQRLRHNAALPAGQTSIEQHRSTVPMHGGVAYTDAAGNPYEMLIDGINAVPGTSPAVIPSAAPLSVPLSTADAQNTAEVLINMLVKPSGGATRTPTSVRHPSPIRSSCAPPPPGNYAGGGTTFGPCQ